MQPETPRKKALLSSVKEAGRLQPHKTERSYTVTTLITHHGRSCDSALICVGKDQARPGLHPQEAVTRCPKTLLCTWWRRQGRDLGFSSLPAPGPLWCQRRCWEMHRGEWTYVLPLLTGGQYQKRPNGKSGLSSLPSSDEDVPTCDPSPPALQRHWRPCGEQELSPALLASTQTKLGSGKTSAWLRGTCHKSRVT